MQRKLNSEKKYTTPADINKLATEIVKTNPNLFYNEIYNSLFNYSYLFLMKRYRFNKYIVQDDIISESISASFEKIDQLDLSKGKFLTWYTTILINTINRAFALNYNNIKAVGYFVERNNIPNNHFKLDVPDFDKGDPANFSVSKLINLIKPEDFVSNHTEYSFQDMKRAAILFYKFKYGTKKIAEMLNVPNNTIKTWLRSFRKKIQKKLNSNYI